MHLLVIEDERTLCETIVRSLRRLAYGVAVMTEKKRWRFSAWSTAIWCFLILTCRGGTA